MLIHVLDVGSTPRKQPSGSEMQWLQCRWKLLH